MWAKRIGPFLFPALLVGLAACAAGAVGSKPSVTAPQNLWAESDDLAMVAESALQQAGQYGQDGVLVVFDIDNTLLAMEQGLGSDQWYYWQKALEKDDPCSDDVVSDRLKVQGALYFASGMRPTQPDAADQVRRLQDAGLTVIALTSRGPDFRLQTFRELRRNDLFFWPSALPPQRGFATAFVPEGGSREALYEDGVFLTAGQDKGVMLQALLKRTGAAAPAVVVIADDKTENLEDVMKAFEGTGTAVHAWRYSGEDTNVASLDTEEAASLWRQVRPALTELEAAFGPDNFDLPPPVNKEDCTAEAL